MYEAEVLPNGAAVDDDLPFKYLILNSEIVAHNISFNGQTGQHAFMSVKQIAWHGLGQIVENYPTSREAIAFTGLDYEVAKAPIFAGGAGLFDTYPVPDQYATLRTDTEAVFGVMGKDYQIVKNNDVFAFFDAIVGGGEGILYETAGALGNEERILLSPSCLAISEWATRTM